VVYPERHGYRFEVIQFLDWLTEEAKAAAGDQTRPVIPPAPAHE
jgi:hypothetical protein